MNYFGGETIDQNFRLMLEGRQAESVDERMFIFTDVWLDKPSVLKDLSTVLSGKPLLFTNYVEPPSLRLFGSNLESRTAVLLRTAWK